MGSNGLQGRLAMLVILYSPGLLRLESTAVNFRLTYFVDIILAFLDVEGNYFTVLGFRYTTILSAQLINFWAIVVGMYQK